MLILRTSSIAFVTAITNPVCDLIRTVCSTVAEKINCIFESVILFHIDTQQAVFLLLNKDVK